MRSTQRHSARSGAPSARRRLKHSRLLNLPRSAAEVSRLSSRRLGSRLAATNGADGSAESSSERTSCARRRRLARPPGCRTPTARSSPSKSSSNPAPRSTCAESGPQSATSSTRSSFSTRPPHRASTCRRACDWSLTPTAVDPRSARSRQRTDVESSSPHSRRARGRT